MQFKNKIVVITGAASGIGAATAKAFASEGASVVIGDINISTGTAVLNEIEDAGGKALFVKTDVSSSTSIQELINSTVKEFGGIDVLHNNAGIQHYGSILSTTENEWNKMLDINLTSMFLAAKYAIPHMQKRGCGSIINTSSVQSFSCQENVLAYSTTKAGILALTRSMAIDLAQYNIRVNAICPGGVDTPMLRWGMGKQVENGDASKLDQIIEKNKTKSLIGRIGKAEEVANVVLFLASDKASLMTGASLVIDGGLLSKLD